MEPEEEYNAASEELADALQALTKAVRRISNFTGRKAVAVVRTPYILGVGTSRYSCIAGVRGQDGDASDLSILRQAGEPL